MKAYRFTFCDIDHPERTTVTTTEGIDERWALRIAIDQLQSADTIQAWDLVSTEEVPDEPAAEEAATS